MKPSVTILQCCENSLVYRNKSLTTIPQQQFLIGTALMKLFVLFHQPFVGALQEAALLFQAYFSGRLDHIALPQTEIEVQEVDSRGRQRGLFLQNFGEVAGERTCTINRKYLYYGQSRSNRDSERSNLCPLGWRSFRETSSLFGAFWCPSWLLIKI